MALVLLLCGLISGCGAAGQQVERWLLLLLTILVIVLGLTIYRRHRRMHSAKFLIDAADKRLMLVLESSGCELWQVELATQHLRRWSAVQLPHSYQLGADGPLATFFKLMHPDDVVNFQAAFKQHLKGQSKRFESVYRFVVDGHTYWLKSTGYVQRDKSGQATYVNGTTADVTELKRKELELARLNEELSKQVEALNQARADLATVEKRRKLALWGSGCEFFESDLEKGELNRENQIPGLASGSNSKMLSDYWPFLHQDDLDAFQTAFIQHVKGLNEFYDVIYRARDEEGGWRWIQTRGRAVEHNAQGRVTKIAGTNYDISELKAAELRLKKLADELDARVTERTADLSNALDELKATQSKLVEQEKMAALGGLVAGVAHEINTPIGVSVTAASHLAEQVQIINKDLIAGKLSKSAFQDFAKDAQTASELIVGNLRRASDLVKSFKRVAADQHLEEMRSIDLARYLNDILNSITPTLKRYGHRCEVHADEGVVWTSYPGALHQIISNLVLNAVYHAYKGTEKSGLIKISAELQHQAAPAQIVIRVSDDGKGIDDSLINKIFDPFFTTSRGHGGTGLGLHLVFNLVTQLLGGEIKVESTPGVGTSFLITAPFVRGDAIKRG